MIRSKKKGMVQMTETIAILFIFFILVLFGVVFYYKYQQVAMKEKQEELLAMRAMDTALKVLFLPELICTKGESEPEDNCFDLAKLKQVNKTFKVHLTEYYYNLFSYAKITVKQVYPAVEGEYMLYDLPKPPLEDGSPGWSKKEATYFVITLKDELAGLVEPNYGFGYIKVEVYS